MNINKRVIRAGLRAARPLFASHRVSVKGKRAMVHLLTAPPAPERHDLRSRHHRGRSRRAGTAPLVVANGTLIYLHGGGYALGSAKAMRPGGAPGRGGRNDGDRPGLLTRTRARYPVALEEMVAVYSQLVENGLDPKKHGHCGRFGGGGLTLALAWRCAIAESPRRQRWA